MKCPRCNNEIDYDKKRKAVYTIRSKDNIVIGLTCRFCGWDMYKKKKPVTKGEDFDSEFA